MIPGQTASEKAYRQGLLLLLGIGVLVNLLLYLRFGVKVPSDSYRYLSYVTLLENGVWYKPHDFWYLGYVAFLFLIKQLSSAAAAVVLGQLFLYFLALAALYSTAYRLSKSSLTALITGLLYLLFLEIPMWNFYLLAESIYASFICFTLYFIVSARQKPEQWWYVLPLVFFTFFIKPTGIALLLALGVYTILHFWHFLVRYKGAVLILVPLATVLLVLLLNRMLGTFVDSILTNDYAKGEIIYGVTTISNYAYADWFTIEHTGDLVFPPGDHPPVLRLFLFFIHNPVYYLKLCAAKLLYHFGHLRPYHSWKHNLFIACYLYPLYYFFIGAVRRSQIAQPFYGFALTFIAVHALIVMITTVDWDGRFIIPTLPVLVLVAGQEVGRQLSNWLSRHKKGGAQQTTTGK